MRLILLSVALAALAAPAGYASQGGDGGQTLPPCTASAYGMTGLIFLLAPNWYGHFTCIGGGWRKDWIRQL